ncbi:MULTISPECIES: YbaB/EbfC family nucleoid-associated protein [unclassified Leeuwenhoekiella]|uniref:YbaB/EbfC family nucleoid-associated protein n=1 Tax=unclassified Leeuwenhoekiella TaxID=2615029 RepID=UPI000C59E34E|nr:MULTISPECIES: YbaB/EbfC family nucleoid-associated protein [unclassified Leeuwenhoekiella]MAW94418.1 nucleoid-associated protein, YbaB/EbfC family [Leeuwenhoekiella sp.]MBA81095.1 nucleoid-associated protein, YbaB/EbfC family [Leeuwenhoekiella sp.]|tara:strand:- start:10498 stop:10821 length:324 start_codon:yes stop_codon:yes gene_type:complete
MFGDMMGMMGKIKEAQQKAEDTKKRLETVYIDEKSSDGLLEVTVSVAGAVKKINIQDELLQDKEQLEDYLILTLNKALSRAKASYEQELAAVAKAGMPDIPGLDMFK